MARLGRRAAYEERVRAVQAVERGQRAEIVAEVLGFARSTVFGWVQAARLGGEQALETRPTPGPPPRLSARQMQRLRKPLVVRDPRQLQFEFALWTRALVA
ncbi:MAG: helix-turn-helix domain-containing protein, partial [Candidatus Dormibacteraeota bacterium]|nr:helix-turn-helix domain-containing protein [Candidatus Dormibacteraeota bacterium]